MADSTPASFMQAPTPQTGTSRSSLDIPIQSAPRSYATSTVDYAAQSSAGVSGITQRPTYFKSRRIEKGKAEKPWLNEKKDPREKWTLIIPLIGLGIGFAIIGLLIYLGLSDTSQNEYCPILLEDFSNGLDSNIWLKEVEVGGFGNGQFEETTNTDENAFIENGELVIKPTLQDPKLINSNNILDLTHAGCTGTQFTDCVAVTNVTNGTIINPVKSARLSTRKSRSIKYGKIEVRAKMPAGDWLWPAIWMLPVNATYGPWPASGEIDLAESRGNNYTYPMGGNDIVSSTLHLGPTPDLDSWYHYVRTKMALHSNYNDKYHTFGLEWTPDYIFTYLDKKPQQIIYNKFSKPFWQENNYPPATANGTRLVDPWSQTGQDSTPFDQDFYLILNVAVGGTNGWFQDGVQSKPWVDASPTAKHDFWNAQSQWLPTWQKKGAGQMNLQSVKMWQLKGYNGC